MVVVVKVVELLHNKLLQFPNTSNFQYDVSMVPISTLLFSQIMWLNAGFKKMQLLKYSIYTIL